MDPLKPIQTREYIADMLREEIFSGALEDGEELAQELLAERLGVSRMPVRDALQQLALEGVLERLPNRHMRVAGMTSRLVEQNFSMLAAVEIEIASILIREGLPIRPVTEAYEQFAATPCVNREDRANGELFVHTALGTCLCNPFLYPMHQRLLKGYFSYVLFHSRYDGNEAPELLQSLSQALEQKDFSKAGDSLRQYFRRAAQTAITMIGGGHRV